MTESEKESKPKESDDKEEESFRATIEAFLAHPTDRAARVKAMAEALQRVHGPQKKVSQFN